MKHCRCCRVQALKTLRRTRRKGLKHRVLCSVSRLIRSDTTLLPLMHPLGVLNPQKKNESLPPPPRSIPPIPNVYHDTRHLHQRHRRHRRLQRRQRHLLPRSSAASAAATAAGPAAHRSSATRRAASKASSTTSTTALTATRPPASSPTVSLPETNTRPTGRLGRVVGGYRCVGSVKGRTLGLGALSLLFVTRFPLCGVSEIGLGPFILWVEIWQLKFFFPLLSPRICLTQLQLTERHAFFPAVTSTRCIDRGPSVLIPVVVSTPAPTPISANAAHVTHAASTPAPVDVTPAGLAWPCIRRKAGKVSIAFSFSLCVSPTAAPEQQQV